MNPQYRTIQEFQKAMPPAGLTWEIYKSQYPGFVFTEEEEIETTTQFPSTDGIGYTNQNLFEQQNVDIFNPIAKPEVQNNSFLDPLAEQQGTEISISKNNPYSNQWIDTPLQPKVPLAEGENLDKNKKNKPSFLDYLSKIPNLGMGISTDDKFKIAGMTLSYKPDFLNNAELEGKAKKANTITGVAAGTAGLLGAVRNVMQGMGIQNRQNQWNDNYWKDQIDLQKQEYKFEDGGELPLFRYGGTFLDIPFEKMALNEYISGLPKAMEDLANAEIEDEEWIIDPTNVVKKAIGNTHEKGGIKTVLKPGTKVVSDNLKLGAKLAKEISSQADLKVTMNHTYAEVIDKYNRKIGLEEKNLELEKLYKKLEKNDDIVNESTKRMNENFLKKEIEKAEIERQRLLEARAIFANKVYNKQQEGKLEKFENGGMFKGGTFEALCKKYNLTKEQGLEMLKQYEDGGEQQMEQPQSSQPMDEETIKQIIEMYSQMVNTSPEELTKQFLGMSEEQLNEELIRMSSELQQNNVMKNGGKIPMYKDGDPIDGDIERLAKKNNTFGSNASDAFKGAGKWAQYYNSLNNYLIAIDEQPVEFKTHKEYQEKLVDVAPEYVEKLIKEGEIPLTNKHRELLGNTKKTKYTELTDKEKEKLGTEGIIEGYVDGLAGHRGVMFEPGELSSKEAAKRKYENDNYKGNLYVDDKGLKKDDNITFYYPKDIKTGSVAPNTTTETPNTEKEIQEQKFRTTIDDLRTSLNQKSKPDNGMLFVPETPNLPPDGIFPHVKREYRTELVDPMTISPESVLRENYRTQETSNMNIDNLPIGMRGAANANLTAITQENNAKAILEAERFNAQNKQQTEQTNVQLNNQDEMMRYNEIPRYEALQLTAMEKTKNDLYNYFNAGINNQLNKYNYINSYNMTKSMFPDITTDIFGVPVVKKDAKTFF